jgi:MFS transporter, SP family, galactose:H+ symporter
MEEGNASKKLLITLATIPVFSGLLVGYNTAVIAGADDFIVRDFSINTFEQEVVVTSILCGAFAGAFLSGPITNKLGQRRVIQLAGLICLIGAIGCSLSTNMTMLVIWRGLLGIACGIGTMVGPLYVAETTPSKWRGAFVSLVQLAITTGIFLSYCTDFALSAAGNWKLMFAIGAIPGAGLIAGMLSLPESPRWLASKGRIDEARAVLAKLNADDGELDALTNGVASESPRWSELFSGPIRAASITASGLFLVQNLSGIDGILYYAPKIFRIAGFQGTSAEIIATAGLGLINVIATVVATSLIDRAGRRPLLLGGLVAMVLSLAVLSISFMQPVSPTNSVIATVSLATFVAAFALSLGPIPYVIMSEIFPARVRDLGMSLAASAAWGCNVVVTITFLSLMETVGQANLFWGYCAIGVAGLAFAYFTVPETRNCSLEDIEQNLLAGMPTRRLGDKRPVS